MICGYYCLAPGDQLSQATLERFLAGIGLKGFGVPEEPRDLALPGQPAAPAEGDLASAPSQSRIAIAIFPFGGWGQRTGTGDILSGELGDVAKQAISEAHAFDLRCSYYGSSVCNIAEISGIERIWGGAQSLDESEVFFLGQRHDLDAVLIYKVEFGPKLNYWDAAYVKSEGLLFDIQSKRVIKKKGDNSRANVTAKELLSEFEAARKL